MGLMGEYWALLRLVTPRSWVSMEDLWVRTADSWGSQSTWGFLGEQCGACG